MAMMLLIMVMVGSNLNGNRNMVLYFDLDGTLANLYSVPSWLDDIQAEDTKPYEVCGLMNECLPSLLENMKQNGFELGVITWTAKGGSKEYNKQVRKAKLEWLERHFKGVFSEFHAISYGTPKSKAAKRSNAVLVDDNAKVRTSWENSKACNAEMPTIDASDTFAMIQSLTALLETVTAQL